MDQHHHEPSDRKRKHRENGKHVDKGLGKKSKENSSRYEAGEVAPAGQQVDRHDDITFDSDQKDIFTES